MRHTPHTIRIGPGRLILTVSAAFLGLLATDIAWPETLPAARQAGSALRPFQLTQLDVTQGGDKANQLPAESPVASASPGKLGNPQQQNLLNQARYWESRGRNDLAAKLRSQAQSAPESSKPAFRPEPPSALNRAEAIPSGKTTPRAFIKSGQATAPSGPPRSPQELEKQARYWQERGREDLAEDILQKLGTLQVAQPARISPVAKVESPERPPAQNDNNPPQEKILRPALEASLQNDPDSQNTRMDLVQIYRGTGELHKARAQIERVLTAKPDLPAALYASAQLYADQRLWRETLDTLEKIGPASRTPEMASLQKMAWAHVQLDRAEALLKQGRNADAKLLLRRVALELSTDVDQPQMAEPPPLWKASPSIETRKKR